MNMQVETPPAKAAIHPARAAQIAMTSLPRVAIVTDGAFREDLEELDRSDAFQVVEITAEQHPDRLREIEPAAVLLAFGTDSAALEKCRELMVTKLAVPLIVLLKSVDPFREALLLEIGADDVIVADRGMQVVIARLRVSRRRFVRFGNRSGETKNLSFGRLQIDAAARAVRIDDKEVHITSSEFDLLWILACNAGRPVGRDELQIKIRGFISDESSRFVDARLHRVRKRLHAVTGSGHNIRSVRSHGYIFSTADW